jgi:hypothetical protein
MDQDNRAGTEVRHAVMLTEHEIASLLYQLGRSPADGLPPMGVGGRHQYTKSVHEAVNALRMAIGRPALTYQFIA